MITLFKWLYWSKIQLRNTIFIFDTLVKSKMNQIHVLRVNAQDAKLYTIPEEILPSSDSTPMISPSVTFNSDSPSSDEKLTGVPKRYYYSPLANNIQVLINKHNQRTHCEKESSDEGEKPLSAFFKRVVLPGSIGGLAGTAAGMFFLPTVGLMTCAIVGGLGITSVANISRSIWGSIHAKSDSVAKSDSELKSETLVVETKDTLVKESTSSPCQVNKQF